MRGVIKHKPNRFRKEVAKTVCFVWALAALCWPLATAAQPVPPASPESDAASPDDPGSDAETEIRTQAPAASEEGQTLEALREKVRELDERDRATQQNVEELRQEIKTLRKENEADELEEMMEIDTEVNKLLRVYGFFDLNFARNFYKEDSVLALYRSDKSTFYSNLHLYIASQMTDSLGLLAEIRFSFLPLGQETSYGIKGLPGDQYERVDTTMVDPASRSTSGEGLRYGSVIIERAHLKYEPHDSFNLLAGRFLTPYGIWNIDHGSPVVIPINLPYVQRDQLVPWAQTGLQVYGRFFPSTRVFFDYAATVSNGRGPTESVLDLNENKGVGVRLKLTYEGPEVSVAFGSYGYYDQYADIKKSIGVAGISPGTEEHEKQFWAEVEETESYHEYAIANDFLLELYDFRLQAEYIYRYVDYTHPTLIDMETLILTGLSFTDEYYSPSHINHGGYLLLAYRLPLDEWIAPLSVLPYLMSEYYLYNDTIPDSEAVIFVGGLNLRPSPFLAVKLEGLYVRTAKKITGSDIRGVRAQLAVSF